MFQNPSLRAMEPDEVDIAAAAEGALSAEKMNEVAEDLDKRLMWQRNAPFLYDLYLQCSLPWPALSVAWLADEPDEAPRLAFGTHTDSSEPCQVCVAELVCEIDDDLRADPWRAWDVDRLGKATGFGLQPMASNAAPLRVVAIMSHPTEVNRLAPCPVRPQLLAAKGSDGSVMLLDYKAIDDTGDADEAVQARLEVPGTEPVDGFALAWSIQQRNLLVSGGNDGYLGLWDVELTSKASAPSRPVSSFRAHKGALNDVSFSPHDSSRLVTVSDDCVMSLWDFRESRLQERPSMSAEIGGVDVLSVDWCYQDQHRLATAGKDKLVRTWDLRSEGVREESSGSQW